MKQLSNKEVINNIVSIRSGKKDIWNYNPNYNQDQNAVFAQLHEPLKSLKEFKTEVNYDVFDRVGQEFSKMVTYLSPMEKVTSLMKLQEEIEKNYNLADFDNNIVWKQRIYQSIKNTHPLSQEEKEGYLDLLMKNSQELANQKDIHKEISQLVSKTDNMEEIANNFLNVTKQLSIFDSKIAFTHLLDRLQDKDNNFSPDRVKNLLDKMQPQGIFEEEKIENYKTITQKFTFMEEVVFFKKDMIVRFEKMVSPLSAEKLNDYSTFEKLGQTAHNLLQDKKDMEFGTTLRFVKEQVEKTTGLNSDNMQWISSFMRPMKGAIEKERMELALVMLTSDDLNKRPSIKVSQLQDYSIYEYQKVSQPADNLMRKFK